MVLLRPIEAERPRGRGEAEGVRVQAAMFLPALVLMCGARVICGRFVPCLTRVLYTKLWPRLPEGHDLARWVRAVGKPVESPPEKSLREEWP